jgi:hypothetical protein
MVSLALQPQKLLELAKGRKKASKQTIARDPNI